MNYLKERKNNESRIGLDVKSFLCFQQGVDTKSSNIKQFLQFIGEQKDMKHCFVVLLQTNAFMDCVKSSAY